MNTKEQTKYERNVESIEVIDIVRTIWKHKVIVLLFTSMGFAAAMIYATLAKPFFETSTSIRPVVTAELDKLNGTELYKITPNETLQNIGSAMDSYDVRLKFFTRYPQYLSTFSSVGIPIERAFENFNISSKFNLKQIDSLKSSSLSDSIELTLRYPEGVDGVRIVREFTKFVIEREKNEIEYNLKRLIENKIEKIEKDIEFYKVSHELNTSANIAKLLEQDSIKKQNLQDELRALRQQVQTKKQNRMKELEEAITIARQLGISNPTTPSSMALLKQNSVGNTMRTEVNNQKIPIYFMGQLALEAELATLAVRSSDDFTEPRINQIQKELNLLISNREAGALKQRETPELFIHGFGERLAELARLKNLAIDFQHLELVKIDKPASEPWSSLSPRTSIIMSLGLFTGFILGITFVLSRLVFYLI